MDTLPEQRNKFHRLYLFHILWFFVVDVVIMGGLLAWVISQPQQPLWKTFVVSASTMTMVCWNLYWAGLYSAVVNHTEETMAVTARNWEEL